VRVRAVGGQHHELLDPAVLPRADEIVEQPVQRLAAHGGASGVLRRGRGIHPIFYGGRAEHLEHGGQVVGEMLHDDRVAAKGEMRSVLLGRPDGDNEPGVPRQVALHLVRREVLQQKGMPVRGGRVAHWEPAVVVTALALAVWLRVPTLPWAVIAAVVVTGGAALSVRARRLGAMAAALLAVFAAGVALNTSLRVRTVERRWDEVRDGLIETNLLRLDATLRDAADVADHLAEEAAALDGEDTDAAFERLDRMMAGEGPERGVVVLGPDSRPRFWGGIHRVPPEPGAGKLIRITPFYVLLESRRQTGDGLAIGHVLVAADSAVPDRSGTVAARFSRRTGVDLQFFAPGAAPDSGDVLDYCAPSCAGVEGGAVPDTLFSVLLEVPQQGAHKLNVQGAGARGVALLVLAVLLTLGTMPGRVVRWAGTLGLAGTLVLTPAGERVGLGPLFSSAFYYLDDLGAFSASAGGLLIAALVVLIAVLRLARRGFSVGRIGIGVGLLLAASSPWVVWWLARGITPPASGVGLGLWLSWQLPLTVAGAALGMAAAVALGSRRRPAPAVLSWVAGAWAVIAVLVGLYTWQPGGPWSVWYGLLWVPAAVLAVLPARRIRLVLTVGAVAGSAAALLVWGAALQGRLALAEQDVRRLAEGDPVAEGLLERFADGIAVEPVPGNAAELYARWRRSRLSREDYPGLLETWSPEGRAMARLALAEVDLPEGALASLRTLAVETGEPVVRSVEAQPGVHYAAAVPFLDGSVVTVSVGPRSRLVAPVLVGRFLRGERRLVQPYQLSLGDRVAPGVSERLGWQREGWSLRGGQALRLLGGARELHVEVALPGLSTTLVRGVLLVLLDLAVLGLLALAGEGVSGTLRLPAALSELIGLRSFRVRLSLALGAFFVIPTLGFATWSIGRIRLDAAHSRDLLIQQTLSEAAGAAQQFAELPLEHVELRLEDLNSRLAADFLWYEDGVIAASTAPVLVELGMVPRFLPPRVVWTLRVDEEGEITSDASIGGQRTRVGYRGMGNAGPVPSPVLAAPRLVDVTDLQREQEDLLFGLVLMTVLGLAGAAALASRAALTLAEPVQALRRAAVAVGRGDSLPPFGPDIPTEFASVMSAFERMARDVEASQAALEAARRRTATVLGNVATGVVAVDTAMQVTIANARAAELLGGLLAPGDEIAVATEEEWRPVWDWVETLLRADIDVEAREFQIGPRRIRAQVAPLRTDPKGCVVALDDTTELARAVRVLAWGELARQIAHEIKNPLTPIRLGVQHLQRARRHGSADFDATLERTSLQILAEIERLDAIARAFARFGTPPAESVPLVMADLTGIARDAAALYSLGSEATVTLRAAGPVQARVRPDEVKEVLINLIENARDARSTRVTIDVRRGDGDLGVLVVRDDGRGITAEHMLHVFEPQFSTTSSGTGLGLAICRRLVESWGGTIDVQSEVGVGTTVTITVGGGQASGGKTDAEEPR
jgi:two-component system nitrogen regulation sensor histidine kinase NtrY